ncbi:unnamed protein product [Cuscuta epithymum]|uniref:Phytochrome n=1 Tax=Cuscuta epithymum TaxID=186058 RepID=A0AAV0G0Z9_9ASTE|nr:unnamed protein product [Cuscuta epithymum]
MDLGSKENEPTTTNKTGSCSKSTTFSSSSASKAMAQYNADAKLMAEFEQSGESGKSFNYTRSVINATQDASEEEMIAYLSRIQRGGLIQPFGCMLAVEEPTFKIIGFSENCLDLLGLKTFVDPGDKRSLIGIDARTLFTLSSRSSLAKAVASREISLLNPIWVHSRSNQKPFYAVLHRIDVGIVIDLEPASSSDPALLLAGAVQSQKLAVRAISRLQSLPGGDIGTLCDTVVEDVQKLTGYDRVMVYKFHDDDHGEVVSEIRRSDLEPYLGLHYPATDIPQAARFLFKQNRVRMICDCNAKPVRIFQTEELKQPLCLVNSTLRSPHSCHTSYMANMGSTASLAMAIVINSGESMKLWGLVVCHHTTSRYVPFPLRYACEFLMQAFSLQLHMEIQLATQLAEKKILRTQSLLCDMLLRDAPLGIVTQSPSVMDLVRCDGAALYYGGKCWLLGVTPNEAQVKDIAEWLLNTHGDSTGLSTDCLLDAGYPRADTLGDGVSGLATARISSKDFLFWFRCHTGKEVKWGGAKHHPEQKDDGGRMHPRSSFNVFLEVVKGRSLPWEDSEINAIHSLQLIMRDSLKGIEENCLKSMSSSSQQSDSEGTRFYELSSMARELVRLIETATVPIFAVDSSGFINGWNSKIAELTGLEADVALGKPLIDYVTHEDSRKSFRSLMCRALQGEEGKNMEVKLLNFGKQQTREVVYLVVNACTSRDCQNDIIGVCFVGQDITPQKVVMDKFVRLQGDYEAIIQNPNPLIPPIFASDQNACCSEWNAAMENLTGWVKTEILGKRLPGEVFGGMCRLKGQDALTKFMILLYRGISGHDTEKLQFGFFDRNGNFLDVFVTANKRTDESGSIIGCFCFLQTSSTRDKQEDNDDDRECVSKLKEFAYIRQQMKNPLNGIRFTHKLLEGTATSDDQKQYLETSEACERQILSIIEDMDCGGITEGSTVELTSEEFVIGSVIDAIVSQVMIPLKEKNVQLLHDIPDHIKSLTVYGDQIKLQLVLSDFLLSVVNYAPSPDGWVEIRVIPGLKLIQDGNEYIHIQFRMTHPGQGLPAALTEDMSRGGTRWTTQEGVALHFSKKLVGMMSGHVQYIKEQHKCYFLIDLDFRTHKARLRGSSMDTSSTN